MTERTRASDPTPEEILARAIASIGRADFVLRALDYLGSAMMYQGCLLTRLNGTRSPEHVYDDVRAERRADVVDRYLDGAYLLDPFYVAYTEQQPCDALRLRDVAPDRFQHSSYYETYYSSIRLRDEAAIFIDLPSGQHLFYSVGRTEDSPRFSQRDMDRTRRILPVFAAINRRHFAAGRPAPEPVSDPAIAQQEIETAMARFGAESLTDRERQIAILILKGHSSKSIAQRIGVSPGTVKIHRRNFYRKLNISAQSELFSMFLGSLTRRA
ncbi:LuxR family transcriptional regulator [Pseudohalocynthiibacter aestuariivivens]|nr:LuxR C-terminal-related transcriptional regulator [Pseudohalocynthiibacter aestuariivivens]QIE44916.1 LuxR family transcriptional regulator [Pseudohalocynthiibacter aestuariivivens]